MGPNFCSKRTTYGRTTKKNSFPNLSSYAVLQPENTLRAIRNTYQSNDRSVQNGTDGKSSKQGSSLPTIPLRILYEDKQLRSTTGCERTDFPSEEKQHHVALHSTFMRRTITVAQSKHVALRQSVWIPKGRSTVKRVINNRCYVCKMLKAKPVNPPAYPFENFRTGCYGTSEIQIYRRRNQ
ncbi:hypothetical protein COOONC_26071 [Cooperia oncophora]